MIANLITKNTIGRLYFLNFGNLIFCFGYYGIKGNYWNEINVPKHSTLLYCGLTYDGDSGVTYSAKDSDQNNIKIKVPNGAGGVFGSHIFMILEK